MLVLVSQNNGDITLFTVLSIERLPRLADLAKSWDGPVSAAVAISNLSSEIPMVVDVWLNTPEMRRNVDVHLVLDDKVIEMHAQRYC